MTTMTQAHIVTADLSTSQTILRDFERIINETQCDLELFRNEQHHLRQQILDILEENNRLDLKLENLKRTNSIGCESGDDARREELTSEALDHIRKQIESLKAENDELRSLNKSAQKTIRNLEQEVQNYREHVFSKSSSIQEFKQKYIESIKLLEQAVELYKTEVANQAVIIKNLYEEKRHLRRHINNMESALREKEADLADVENDPTFKALKDKVKEYEQRNEMLIKTVEQSKRLVDERIEREKVLLEKVQEAIAIAETAVREKDEAEKRQLILKEECDNLAATIGQVMEEAATKVEKDMEAIHKKYIEKESALQEMQKELKHEIQQQKDNYYHLECRCLRFEHKYKEALKTIERLTRELNLSTDALGKLERKFIENENLLREDKMAVMCAEEYEHEIQCFILRNKQLTEKYKSTIEDTTRKFEKEIYRIQKENAHLKAQIQILRLRKSYPTEAASG